MEFMNNLNKIAPEKPSKVPKRKFIIEDVITKDCEKAEPCLVQFSNGFVKDCSEIRGRLYHNMSEKYKHKRSRRILQATGNRLTYTGKNFDDAFDKNFHQRNFLGVLNKQTNKMKLIEISSFLLHPEASSNVSKGVNILSSMSVTEQRRELNENFGGRRARALIKKREQNEFNIEEMSTALTIATNTITIEDDDLEIEEKEIFYKEILPPCNKDALLVHEVYKLEDIIPDVQLVLYNDDAVEYLDGNKDGSKFSILFKQTLANAKLSVEEEEAAKLICIALFTENLIQLQKTKPRTQPEFISCPKAIKYKIFESFTEGKAKKRNKLMEDKLVAHIIVLSLIANQFELEWTTLLQSLGVRRDRLLNLLSVVGATFQKNKGSVILKLPLAKFTSKFTNKRPKQRR